MNPVEEEIARALVACPKWQWLPGMLDERGDRVVTLLAAEKETICFSPADGWRVLVGEYPDLTDPLTRLGVQEVVRLAFGADNVAVRRHVTHLGAPRPGATPRRKVSYAAFVTRWDDADNAVLWNEFQSTPLAALLAALKGAP